ncbi:MAG TPA: ribonuclease HII [Verrucomicrobiota bacterium]|nr:ribonuclease HII [Verrucomicrobiota bacterium]HNU51682.1 ribonuclease HII [Verrucomicrobiota bacterium]
MSPIGNPDRWAVERSLLARGIERIAGVDEVGRGPLAGPVLAAAASFPSATIRDSLPANLEGLTDSKQLTPRQREQYAAILLRLPGFRHTLWRVDPPEIDASNILAATHTAMRKALSLLDPPPDHALIDGLPVPGLPVPHTALVRGDARSYSIAAASVLAKVTRDRLMVEYDREYPGYGFARHKGYATAAHLEALARHGPCPIHRRSFAPLRSVQGELGL